MHNAGATEFVLAAMRQYKKQSQLLNYDPYRYDLKGAEEKENANVCTSHAVNEISIMLYHTLLWYSYHILASERQLGPDKVLPLMELIMAFANAIEV